MLIVSLKTLHQDHMDAYCVIKDIASGSYGCLLCHLRHCIRIIWMLIVSLKAIHQDLLDSHYVTKALHHCVLYMY